MLVGERCGSGKCWVGGAAVSRVRHQSGFSSDICFLHLFVFKLLACCPVRPILAMGDLWGWRVLGGALHLSGRLEGCGVDVGVGVREVLSGSCWAM